MASEPNQTGTPPQRGAFQRFLERPIGDSQRDSGLFGAALIVIAGILGSRLLGLVRSVAIADSFGTDPELASYWVAFRLPDLVFQLLAGATLAAAFIPVYSRVLMHEGREAGSRLASQVLNLVSLATLIVAVATYLATPVIVPLLAPGLGEATGRSAELQELAIDLTRLLLLSPIAFGVSGMLTGILNARHHFLAPALAPMIYNLSIIFGALVLSRPLGIHGLACGVVIGAFGHLLIQIPALWHVGMKWRPSLSIRARGVRDVLRLMGPRVIGLGAVQLNFLVLIFFASSVSDAAISAINYAFLMMMLPVGVIGMAIGTAFFPTFAQQAVARQFGLLRGSISHALRTVLLLAVPISLGLLLLAEPAVRIFFERGAFDQSSTELVAEALVLFAVAIFAHAGTEILSRGFYALEDTRTPVQVAVLAMVANALLAFVLVRPFGLSGLAAAASLSAVSEFAALVLLLRSRLDGFDRRGLGSFALRLVLATTLMGLVMILMRVLLSAAGLGVDTLRGALILAAAAGSTGTAAFVAAVIILLDEEYQSVRTRVRR